MTYKIKVGDVLKDGTGQPHEVVVIKSEVYDYPVTTDTGCWYTLEGRWSRFGPVPDYDLILPTTAESEMKTTYSQEFVTCLRDRITELEAQIAQQASQIAALTPKPKVVSEWMNICIHGSSIWCDSREIAACDSRGDIYFIGRVRKDTITHPDGLVEYKLEVEK